MWDMTELTKKLKEKNFKRHLETSGAYDITEIGTGSVYHQKNNNCQKNTYIKSLMN